MIRVVQGVSKDALNAVGLHLHKAIVKRECLRWDENDGRYKGRGTGTYVHHGGILLAALYKLTVSNPGILVLVHTPEYFFHPLAGKINACWGKKGEGRTFSGVSSFSGSFSIWPVIL